MTHFEKLLLVVASLVVLYRAPSAQAQSDITLVSRVDPQLIDAQALRAALEGPRSTDRPLLIGARIDPAQYAAQF